MHLIRLIAGGFLLTAGMQMNGAQATAPAADVGQGQVSGAAQSQPAGGPNTAADLGSARGKSDNGDWKDARDLAIRGDVAAAEKALTSHSKFPENSGDWHLETSAKLIHLASDVVRDGKMRTARALADAALLHLSQGAAVAPNNHEKANVKAMEAYIHQRYRGDPAAALASYEAALALDPGNAAVKEAHAFLKDADAKLRARTNQPRK